MSLDLLFFTAEAIATAHHVEDQQDCGGDEDNDWLIHCGSPLSGFWLLVIGY
jgi:hypothetical protein